MGVTFSKRLMLVKLRRVRFKITTHLHHDRRRIVPDTIESYINSPEIATPCDSIRGQCNFGALLACLISYVT